ncbi:hypothetical protein PUND_a0278 [Pseudoalteromonas undina]|nr:hypothetical protein PUND_a0278 [Pseudoalteromonas undina]
MPVARHNALAPARFRPSVVVALLNLAIVTSVFAAINAGIPHSKN